MKRVEIEQRVNEDQTRLARVEQRLRYIEQEQAMDSAILVKDLPEQKVAAVGLARPGLRFDNFDNDSGNVVSASSLWLNLWRMRA